MTERLLSISDLNVTFSSELGRVDALRGISFDIPKNSITAVVGESGSGKSVTANSVMRLLPGTATLSGTITLQKDTNQQIHIHELSEGDPHLRELRGGLVSMVFQEPMTALSPVHSIGDQVTEAVLCHRESDYRQAWAAARAMLSQVGFNDVDRQMAMYPFQFSGGMRQRVVIAMALVCNPMLLICDEPTTALDVTIQAEILVLIKKLQQELKNSVLFITHDLGVVAQIADRVVVMYQGQIMETGTVREVLKTPQHPYTAHLLASLPGAQPSKLSQQWPRYDDAESQLEELSEGRQVRVSLE